MKEKKITRFVRPENAVFELKTKDGMTLVRCDAYLLLLNQIVSQRCGFFDFDKVELFVDGKLQTPPIVVSE